MQNTVGRVNFVRKKFRHIRNRYTNEKIEWINLRTCALKTKFFPRPVSVVSPKAGGPTSYFERDTCIRGYHEYKAIWAAVGEELECRREPTNLVNVWTSLLRLFLHLFNCTALLAASIALMVHQDWRDPYQVQLFEKSHEQLLEQFSYSSP